MESIIPVERYRRLLGDRISSDEKIMQRLQYLEALCRRIIRAELKKHVQENKAVC